MSQYETYYFELEEQRRIEQRLYEERLRNETMNFLTRNEQFLQNLIQDAQSCPNSLQKLQEYQLELENIKQINNYNSREAKERQIQLSTAIYALPNLIKQEQETIKLLKHQQQIQLNNQVFDEIKEWPQSIRNFAYNELNNLKSFDRNIIQKIYQNAIKQEQKYQLELQKVIQHQQKQDIIAEIQKENLLLNNNSLEEKELEKEKLSQLQDRLTSLQKQNTQNILDESVRKEVVKSVFITLKQAGFVVNHPKKQDDMVLIQAKKPSGNTATFEINLKGLIKCKFDNYKGQLCQNDIKKVIPKLTDIYGIKLSNKRILWSNPDDLDKDAIPIAPLQKSKK